jgi:hypothetical protein
VQRITRNAPAFRLDLRLSNINSVVRIARKPEFRVDIFRILHEIFTLLMSVIGYRLRNTFHGIAHQGQPLIVLIIYPTQMPRLHRLFIIDRRGA